MVLQFISIRSFAGSLAAGLCLLAAAPAAQAAKLVFDVHVTEGYGAPAFTPFTFQQSWTFSPAPTTRTLGSDPQYLSQWLSYPAFATADGTPSPVTGRALEAGDYGDFDGSSQVSARTRTRLDGGVPAESEFSYLFSRQMVSEVPIGPGLELYNMYSMSISGFRTLPATDTRVMTARVFADLLEESGPLRWFEAGEHSLVDVPGDGTRLYHQQDVAIFIGTATLNRSLSVVPEPRTWALMIVGFSSAGAALRRRIAVT